VAIDGGATMYVSIGLVTLIILIVLLALIL
jgi:hypothetical protein